MRWYAQDEVNQEESEQNEVDGVKKGVDSTGKVTQWWGVGEWRKEEGRGGMEKSRKGGEGQGEVDSGAQLEQGRRLAKVGPEELCE